MRACLFEQHELGSIEQSASAWIDAPTSPADIGDRLQLSSAIHLAVGGAAFYRNAGLSPEYRLVRKVLCRRGIIGYVFYDIHQNANAQLREMAIKGEVVSNGEGLAVYLPHPFDLTMTDGCTGETYELPRCAVVTTRLPQRGVVDISRSDAARVIESKSADEALGYLHRLNVTPSPDHRAILVDRWTGGSHRRRVGDIFNVFGASCFNVLGRAPHLTTLADGWPLESPSFPSRGDGESQDFDTSSSNGASALQNVLANIPFHAKLFRISQAQEQLIESSLIPLGEHDGAWPYETEFVPWVGLTAGGSVVYGSGALKVGSSRLHVVNVIGGTRVGERVFMDAEYRRPLGNVAALLVKSHNHVGYIKPEEQRGIGLVVTQ